jgi:hypothetical protein
MCQVPRRATSVVVSLNYNAQSLRHDKQNVSTENFALAQLPSGSFNFTQFEQYFICWIQRSKYDSYSPKLMFATYTYNLFPDKLVDDSYGP